MRIKVIASLTGRLLRVLRTFATTGGFPFLLCTPGLAKLTVVTTTEELASLAQAVGKDRIQVSALAKGIQDPHYLEPKPSFLVRLVQADLLVANGLSLEVGWLPVLLQKARRPHLMPGGRGFFEAAEAVEPIEVNLNAQRSDGDVHPQGNPHFLLDPLRVVAIVKKLQAKLAALDPSNAKFFETQAESFASEIQKRMGRWTQKLSALKKARVIGYHRTFDYLFARFEMEIVGFLEPKPGIPPTAAHTLALIQSVKTQGVKLIVVENYFDPKPGQTLSEKTGARLVVAPPAIGSDPESRDYFSWYERLVKLLAGEAA